MFKSLVLSVLFLTVEGFRVMNDVDSKGVTYSPNYPDNYDNNMNVDSSIEVAPNSYIHLTFLDFNTEDPYDYLNIIDANTGVSIVNFTGSLTGTTYDLNVSRVTFRFVSDLTTTYRGYAIRFESILDGMTYEPDNTCPNETHSDSFGIISSPNWPLNYPDNIACSYLLTAPADRVISLEFLAFDTEPEYDYVCVYDGSDKTAPLLGVFSGVEAIPILNTTGPNMFIYFSSDLVSNYSGFSALYLVRSDQDNSRHGVVPSFLQTIGYQKTTTSPRSSTTGIKPLASKVRNGFDASIRCK
ncbi:unnamed protein product [Caenorhabditis auriculariae]|uniref:CUB domain-containing protein n=1 Tax=Caenorhabditis auriculariae TaxID=2777116 RepID=A0A8S1HY63_9PELO|nr:unnamed protein product [Caenorhabditis auriculariae]